MIRCPAWVEFLEELDTVNEHVKQQTFENHEPYFHDTGEEEKSLSEVNLDQETQSGF